MIIFQAECISDDQAATGTHTAKFAGESPLRIEIVTTEQKFTPGEVYSFSVAAEKSKA